MKQAKEKGVNLILGTDCIAADDFKNDANTQVCLSNDIPEGWEGMDAGPATRESFAAAIKSAKTILWNGLQVCLSSTISLAVLALLLMLSL